MVSGRPGDIRQERSLIFCLSRVQTAQRSFSVVAGRHTVWPTIIIVINQHVLYHSVAAARCGLPFSFVFKVHVRGRLVFAPTGTRALHHRSTLGWEKEEKPGAISVQVPWSSVWFVYLHLSSRSLSKRNGSCIVPCAIATLGGRLAPRKIRTASRFSTLPQHFTNVFHTLCDKISATLGRESLRTASISVR